MNKTYVKKFSPNTSYEKINYGTYYYGQCTAVDRNFDPTEDLENLIKNNKKN